eukprot:scaffold5499_cov137-Skeletonema_dohrnii-CCMP3373.AAC.10
MGVDWDGCPFEGPAKSLLHFFRSLDKFFLSLSPSLSLDTILRLDKVIYSRTDQHVVGMSVSAEDLLGCCFPLDACLLDAGCFVLYKRGRVESLSQKGRGRPLQSPPCESSSNTRQPVRA